MVTATNELVLFALQYLKSLVRAQHNNAVAEVFENLKEGCTFVVHVKDVIIKLNTSVFECYNYRNRSQILEEDERNRLHTAICSHLLIAGCGYFSSYMFVNMPMPRLFCHVMPFDFEFYSCFVGLFRGCSSALWTA